MQTFVSVGSISSWSQLLKCDSIVRTSATMQHDKVNSVFSIFSDILLYVDGRFEYVVCLCLYHLSYHNYPTFSVTV